MMDINSQLKELILKKSINHKEKILEEKNLKSAHIYCILNNLSSQSYGCLLEFYISKKYEMKKINNNLNFIL